MNSKERFRTVCEHKPPDRCIHTGLIKIKIFNEGVYYGENI